jgi:glyceraldehyde-3-phosphate dehydrogenase/erythrose-4-phosphate dehydrogenase
MAGILTVCEEELVSSDFKRNGSSAAVDAKACVELNSNVSFTPTYTYIVTEYGC